MSSLKSRSIAGLSESLKDNQYSDFEKIKFIGRGTFAQVYHCKDKNTNEEFVVKKINISDSKHEKSGIEEIKILASITSHDRLVQFYGSVKSKKSLKIFLEFVPQGSLDSYLKDNGGLPDSRKAIYTSQLIEGIEYLHGVNIIHRDIKPANILMVNDMNIKLADFGVSKIVAELTALDLQTFCGTIKYMAPELLHNQEYNNSVDYWSLGVTIVEMHNGKPVFPNLNAVQFMCQVATKNIHFDLNPPSSKELNYFLSLNFILSARNRPTADDLKRTKFIRNNICSF